MATQYTSTHSRAIPTKLTELGRIRLGDREPNSKGTGTHPHKLDHFRLTSSNKPLLEYAARHPDIGGVVTEWTEPSGYGRQWELYTATDVLDVVIPTFSAISLSYERWSTAGCEQRCTGEFITHCGRKEHLIGTECTCPADDQERARLAQEGKACARILRLNVILPDLPGTGVWRLETKGFYATAELMGRLQLLKEAGAEHMMIEAVLRLEQRTVQRIGKGGTLHFAVPVLWPKYTFRQIAAAREAQQTMLLTEAQKAFPAPERAAVATDELFGDGAGDVFRASSDPRRNPATQEGQIERLLTDQGLTQAQRDTYWQGLRAKHADLSPGLLTSIYEKLEQAAKKRGTRSPQNRSDEAQVAAGGVERSESATGQARGTTLHQEEVQETSERGKKAGSAVTSASPPPAQALETNLGQSEGLPDDLPPGHPDTPLTVDLDPSAGEDAEPTLWSQEEEMYGPEH